MYRPLNLGVLLEGELTTDFNNINASSTDNLNSYTINASLTDNLNSYTPASIVKF